MIRAYTKTAVRLTLIVGVVVLLALVTVFNDGAIGSTFSTNTGTGGLELKIDNNTWYNGVLQPHLSWTLKHLVPWSDYFFKFNDVKPGDTGTTTISVHIKNGPAWACLDFANLVDKENGKNEPESLVDNNLFGELSGELEFFAWNDDGDNKFELGEKPLFGTSSQSAIQVLNATSYPLSDYTHGPAYANNSTHYVGINWCAGNLSVNLATAKVTCDGEVMGNESQTDSMTVDVSIRSISASSQPKFTCVIPPVVQQCEIEGHKYDKDGKPLEGWTIGLMKVITHNKGVDTYDLATDVTDKDGYYCLEWDGEKRTPRGPITYKSGPYTFVYRVYEKMMPKWQNVSIEKGSDFNNLSVVPSGSILTQGDYVSVQMGVQNGYIFANAAYHIDFYNKKANKLKEACVRVAHNAWGKIKGKKS